MDIEIIFENKDFLVINKPAGILVHSVPNSKFSAFAKASADRQIPNSNLTDWLIKKYPEIKKVGDDPENRPGIVHRLDKDTSGLMVVAKNQETFFYFKKLFHPALLKKGGVQERRIVKKYRALVYGIVKAQNGIIDKPLGYKGGTIKRTARSDAKDIKSAITFYKVLSRFEKPDNGCTLMDVEPKTGRTHQIRVHLASIGHPVVGDQIYGRRKKIPEEFQGLKRQFLHAYFLEFPSIDGKGIMRFESDLPSELNNILKFLENMVK